MSNSEKKIKIDYWNPEWINDSFIEDYLKESIKGSTEEQIYRRVRRFHYFFLSDEIQHQHKHINHNTNNTCNITSKTVG